MDLECLICKRVVIFWKNLLINSSPLSECTFSTFPPLPITWSIKTAATTGADFPVMGTAVKYLKNKSILVRQ